MCYKPNLPTATICRVSSRFVLSVFSLKLECDTKRYKSANRRDVSRKLLPRIRLVPDFLVVGLVCSSLLLSGNVLSLDRLGRDDSYQHFLRRPVARLAQLSSLVHLYTRG
jgi:hypothetical protein